MRVACLVSGGKDSLYATYVAQQKGWDVRYLVGMVSENNESWMFQSVTETDFKILSERIGIPIIIQATKGEQEKELEDLKNALSRAHGIDCVVSGAVLSDYQKHRIDMVCEELGLRSFAPLWRKDGEMLLHDVIDAGFKAEIVSTAAEGLDMSYVGKIIDDKLFEQLKLLNKKYGIHVMGEGGEYETLVREAPVFTRTLQTLSRTPL